MSFVLYTMAEATERFNHELRLKSCKATVRNQLRAADLTIHIVGNQELVTHDDLERLLNMERPKRGRPPKEAK